MNTDQFAVPDLFNEKFVSMSKTLAASIPFTTEGLANDKKSLFFYQTDSLEISDFAGNLKNHEAAGIDRLTAEAIKVFLDVICDGLTYLVNGTLSSGVFPKILKLRKWF